MSRFSILLLAHIAISAITVRSQVLSTHESNPLLHLTSDSLVQDEMCENIIHDNPCVAKALENLVKKINIIDKKVDTFSVYQKTVEDNFSELHILKHKFKILSETKVEKLKKAASINENQNKKKSKRNKDTKNSMFKLLLELFWHKLKSYNWLELIDAQFLNTKDNSTAVRIIY